METLKEKRTVLGRAVAQIQQAQRLIFIPEILKGKTNYYRNVVWHLRKGKVAFVP